jgi:putative hydrolase of HD superfamily
MCLIHDLAESEIGDIIPEEKASEESHRTKEDSVLVEIFSTLPRASKKRLTKDWKELLRNKSMEARLVWQIDKLEMGLQMKDYVNSGTLARAIEGLDPSKFLDKEMRKILENY